MRLATRTGLAALAAATLGLVALGAAFNRTLARTLEDRVDDQLESRAENAPILVAIADRLARSELSTTVEGARVVADGEAIELGRLPEGALPPVGAPGYSTASLGGERWRLLTIEVSDVPRVGDEALVQLVSPLGDVDTRTRALRRQLAVIGALVAAGAGLAGYLLGRAATRPLGELRADAGGLDDADPATWTLRTTYGSPDVDEVAGALNSSLEQLAAETQRRQAALEAARAFASSATHELRTPLQSALTNLDIARSPLAAGDVRSDALEAAHGQLHRMASGLAAVRALANAEFADPSWFAPSDLAEVVDVAVQEESRRAGVPVTVSAEPGRPVSLWRDGVQLAVANVVRNAIVHGGGQTGPPTVTVTVRGAEVVVDDDGPGIPESDRARVLQRFERASDGPGSGLGLTIAEEVARCHGGHVTVGASSSGGARIVLRFSTSP